MSRPLNGSRIGRTDLLIVPGHRPLGRQYLGHQDRIEVALAPRLQRSPAGPGRRSPMLPSLSPGRGGSRSRGKATSGRRAGLGLLGITFYQVFFIKAVSMMDASTASIVMGTSPIFIALLATAVGEERISLAGWVGIALSFGGFLLVISGENGGLSFTWEAWRGAVLILVANVCWAGYTVFSKPVLERKSAFRLAAVGTIAGTAVYSALAAGISPRSNGRVPGRLGGHRLLRPLAIFLCFVLWYQSVKRSAAPRRASTATSRPFSPSSSPALFSASGWPRSRPSARPSPWPASISRRSGYRFFERKRAGRATRVSRRLAKPVDLVELDGEPDAFEAGPAGASSSPTAFFMLHRAFDCG